MKSLFNFGFSKIQCGTLYFLLVFLLALGFQLRDSAVAALPLCHASHNMGIFQTVLVQIALQVRVKIAQFAAVKNIISTDFAALFVLQIFLDRNKAEMQMRLAALVIMVNSTPFVRQYGILSNKWGVLLCQKEYQTNDIRQNSKSW